ncbi:MAG: hypothetical protein AAFX85_17950, partial [Pseudomonadota bacterium]
ATELLSGVLRLLLCSEFPDSTIHLITPSSGGDAGAMLARAGFEGDQAAVYAAQIAQGRSLVGTSPAFGSGARVQALLGEFGPIAVALPATASRTGGSARYTPFSDIIGFKLLTEDTRQAWWWTEDMLKRPDVTSLGIPRLQGNYNMSFGIPRLQRKYNWSFGVPRLHRNYNLSFGIPRLQRKYNWSFGIPRLKRAYNLSFGIPRLIYTRSTAVESGSWKSP